MKVLIPLATLAGLYSQGISTNLHLGQDGEDPALYFYNNAAAKEDLKHCRNMMRLNAIDQGMPLDWNTRRLISKCLAKHAARDAHKIIADPHGKECWNMGGQNRYDTIFSEDILNCYGDAANKHNVCESELEAVPSIRDFIAKIDDFTGFYWCYNNIAKGIHGDDSFEDTDKAWDVSRAAIGECLKENGQRAVMGPFTKSDLRGLTLLFKRNCRLSIHDWANSPCAPNERWGEDGTCEAYDCFCDGSGRVPADGDSDSVLETCDADGVEACVCPDGSAGCF